MVAKAIKCVRRDQIYVVTKAQVPRHGKMIPVNDVVASLENSLRQLDTDYLDVSQFHGIPPDIFNQTRDAYAPVLLREKEKGKIRHLGIMETPPNDPASVMLKSAAQDPIWKVPCRDIT